MTIRTRLTSERRRMCAKHPEKPASQLRQYTDKAQAGVYVVMRPECSDCAARKKPEGTTKKL